MQASGAAASRSMAAGFWGTPAPNLGCPPSSHLVLCLRWVTRSTLTKGSGKLVDSLGSVLEDPSNPASKLYAVLCIRDCVNLPHTTPRLCALQSRPNPPCLVTPLLGSLRGCIRLGHVKARNRDPSSAPSQARFILLVLSHMNGAKSSLQSLTCTMGVTAACITTGC